MARPQRFLCIPAESGERVEIPLHLYCLLSHHAHLVTATSEPIAAASVPASEIHSIAATVHAGDP